MFITKYFIYFIIGSLVTNFQSKHNWPGRSCQMKNIHLLKDKYRKALWIMQGMNAIKSILISNIEHLSLNYQPYIQIIQILLITIKFSQFYRHIKVIIQSLKHQNLSTLPHFRNLIHCSRISYSKVSQNVLYVLSDWINIPTISFFWM